MKIKFLLILITIFSTIPLFAQDGSDIEKDLLLSNNEFKFKYIKEIKSPRILIRDYNTTNSIQDRIAIAYRLCDFLENPTAFKHLINILEENRVINGQLEPNWKLKSIIVYQLGVKGQNIEENKRRIIQKTVLKLFKNSDKPRLLAASALTLSRLSPNPPGDTASSRLFNQRTISYALVEKMLTLTKNDNYLCWALCKASLINKDSYTINALNELKKLTFVPYVRKEIRKTIKLLEKTN